MSVITCPGPGSGKTVLLRSWISQAGAAGLSERVARVPAGRDDGHVRAGRMPAVGCEEHYLAAEPAEGVLMVAGEVLPVALVATVVVVGARVGVAGVVGHHGPGDRQQGVRERYFCSSTSRRMRDSNSRGLAPNTLSNDADQRSPASATVRDLPEHHRGGRW
jgi:hypothetical protein